MVKALLPPTVCELSEQKGKHNIINNNNTLNLYSAFLDTQRSLKT